MFVVRWYEGALLKLARDKNLRETDKKEKYRRIKFFPSLFLIFSLVSDDNEDFGRKKKFTSPHSTSHPRDMVKTYLLT